jgi:hypothetical protein
MLVSRALRAAAQMCRLPRKLIPEIMDLIAKAILERTVTPPDFSEGATRLRRNLRTAVAEGGRDKAAPHAAVSEMAVRS